MKPHRFPDSELARSVARLELKGQESAAGEPGSRPEENTRAKLNPATCQNQTLLTRKPTPAARSPRKESASAVNSMAHACQYARPPWLTR